MICLLMVEHRVDIGSLEKVTGLVNGSFYSLHFFRKKKFKKLRRLVIVAEKRPKKAKNSAFLDGPYTMV